MSTIEHDANNPRAAFPDPSSHAPDDFVRERLPAHPSSEVGIGWTVDESELYVIVIGMVCTWSVRALTQRIGELAWQYPERCVRLDLREVSFADARLVSMLVELRHTCRTVGSHLRLTDCSPPAERVLQLCDVIEGLSPRSCQCADRVSERSRPSR